MAHAMSLVPILRGSSHQINSGSSRFTTAAAARIDVPRVRAQKGSSDHQPETSRRTMLGVVAAGLASVSFVQTVLADEPKPIKIGPPPPPSGGLPGTLNSDQARDLRLPLKDRFFLQPLAPEEAAQRAKESAKDIVHMKELIEKKAWPYVQNDLRLKAEYLRYDLNTVIASKTSKEEKKILKDLTGKLFQSITNLDYAAKNKNSFEAEKYYAEALSALDDVFSRLG